MALALWDHFGKKEREREGEREGGEGERERERERERVCFFLYLCFPLLFLSLKAFNSYPAWKNLPDCIKPDATEIVHFLMRSRADSTVKRYLAKRNSKGHYLVQRSQY